MIRKFKDFTPSIGKRVFVDEQATVIGDVSLGDDVSVWPQSVIRGDINPITIGERTNIQDGSIVHVTHKSQYSEGYQCHIGADVTIGHGCIIHACTIEDMALVGMGSVILDGTIISKKVILQRHLNLDVQARYNPTLKKQQQKTESNLFQVRVWTDVLVFVPDYIP